jgi:small subunit ribosomal protein S16
MGGVLIYCALCDCQTSESQANSLYCRTARNSRPLEVLGTYDPIPKPDPYDDSGALHKDIRLDRERAQYWIGVGAQPTDTVWRLLSMVGILPKKQFGPKPTPAKGTVKTDEVRIR